jgi:outer membrane lipoprotein-sorting protein
MTDPTPPDDIVDRAAAELLRTPVPDGPPPETVARTLAALRAAEQSRHPFLTRRFVMRTLTGAAAAALVATAVYLANPFGPSVAFADVAQKFRDARTMSYRYTVELPGEANPLSIKTLYRDPNQARTESPDGTVSILDTATGTGLVLNPHTKTALKIRMPASARAGADANSPAGVVELFRKLPDQPNKPLGEKEVNGVKAKGFAVEVGGQTMNVWADAKTGLPVRAEMTVSVAGKEAKVVMDQFVFGAPLDEKLFRQELPAGYTLSEVNVPEVKEAAPEEDVAAVLRWYADRRKGELPARLDDWGALAALVAEKAAQSGQPAAEDMAAMVRVGRVTAKLSGLAKDEHGYAGAGVKLGDASRVVFWYRPKGAEKYRAVFGDLSVKDVSRDQLPKP